jgi:protein-disulfide isomerase
MSKQFLAIVAAVIIVFVGLFAITGNKSNNSSGKSSSSKTLTQHVEGKGTTGVTLVEYGDYQCPFCEQYYPVVKQVQAEFNDQIKFQFRNYPLTNLHQNAFAAARAAEAAGLQDKFWEMHDMLYEPANWQVWTASSNAPTEFNRYAQQLGLNVDQFKKDFASIKVNDLINADMAEGNRLGISGTPSFYLDGKHVEIGASLPAFEKVIKAEIAKKAPAQATTNQ